MKNGSKRYSLMLLMILAVQMVVICFFGVQKQGFHQDEYYSYFSTNRSLGFYYPDREWVDTDTLRDEFVVKAGEGFNYGLVHLVQSWDVHPPLFYDLLHTVCSLTPEAFSKWQGIAVNLVAFVICFILLYRLSVSIGMSKGLRLVTLVAFGFNPMTISCVMFIRMYMWLTVFVLASALIHMRMINLIKRYYKEQANGRFKLARHFDAAFKKNFCKNLAFLMIIDFLGFLTQYYYLIFMTMIGFSFSIWFIFLMSRLNSGKKEDDAPDQTEMITSLLHRVYYILVYGAGSIIALGLSVAVYPSALSHILRGYRGKEAVAAFADSGNFGMRLSFFFGLLNKYLLSGFMIPILILFALSALGLLFFIRVKKEKDGLHISNVRVLVSSSVLYFLLVAKTALLLGDTSNRYEMPVYPLVLLLSVYFVRIGVRTLVGNRSFENRSIPVIITAILFVAIDVTGLASKGHVLFLYPEDAERIEFAAAIEEEDIPVIVMFNEKTPDNIWRLTDELLEYDRLYYVSEDNTEAFNDEVIKEADEIIVYAADHDNRDELLKKISQINPKVTDVEEISVKDMWTLYRFL